MHKDNMQPVYIDPLYDLSENLSKSKYIYKCMLVLEQSYEQDYQRICREIDGQRGRMVGMTPLTRPLPK